MGAVLPGVFTDVFGVTAGGFRDPVEERVDHAPGLLFPRGVDLLLVTQTLLMVQAFALWGLWEAGLGSYWVLFTVSLVGGVLIALRPSAATLTMPALVAIVGSFSFAVFLIITRMLRGTSDLVMVGGQFAGMLVVSAVVAPFGWVSTSARDFGLMMVLGVVAMAAFACVNRSLKLAPASVVVPYQYTMIVWAVALGWLVFGDVPDAFTLTGAAIIVGAGLYILWREQIVTRREPIVAAPPD